MSWKRTLKASGPEAELTGGILASSALLSLFLTLLRRMPPSGSPVWCLWAAQQWQHLPGPFLMSPKCFYEAGRARQGLLWPGKDSDWLGKLDWLCRFLKLLLWQQLSLQQEDLLCIMEVKLWQSVHLLQQPFCCNDHHVMPGSKNWGVLLYSLSCHVFIQSQETPPYNTLLSSGYHCGLATPVEYSLKAPSHKNWYVQVQI